MTVFKPKGGATYYYDFVFEGQRYTKSTKQTRREDAERVEGKLKEQLRQRAAGIFIPGREDSPTFQSWLGVFYAFKAKQLERPEAIGNLIPVLLRFWGSPEGVTPSEATPCHDLRLVDPIRDPEWILKFEAWLAARQLSNQSKNHYRGVLRRAYAVALLPEFRARTNVALNPFAGVPNDPTFERTVTLTPTELERWIRAASYHVRLAVAIGALAPKLRLRNVLDLQWAVHVHPDPRKSKFAPKLAYFIEVAHHKTARKTRRPLVVPISAQLLRILKDAHARDAGQTHLITYHGKPVHDITGGVKAAVEAAGLTYGRDVPGGVTFHTIRHTAATLISEGEADPLRLKDAMGHGDLRTTLKYRHMRPTREKPTLERLSRKIPIERWVTAPRARAEAPRPKRVDDRSQQE